MMKVYTFQYFLLVTDIYAKSISTPCTYILSVYHVSLKREFILLPLLTFINLDCIKDVDRTI